MKKLWLAYVDYSTGYDTDNYIVMAETKEEAVEKIKNSVGKTAWKSIEKRIMNSIGPCDDEEVMVITQSWD